MPVLRRRTPATWSTLASGRGTPRWRWRGGASTRRRQLMRHSLTWRRPGKDCWNWTSNSRMPSGWQRRRSARTRGIRNCELPTGHRFCSSAACRTRLPRSAQPLGLHPEHRRERVKADIPIVYESSTAAKYFGRSMTSGVDAPWGCHLTSSTRISGRVSAGVERSNVRASRSTIQ